MKAPGVGQMNRRVKICSSRDVVTTDGELSLTRQDVREAWAAIVSNQKTVLGADGFTRELARTHRAIMRAQADLDLTNAAWLFESRRITANLWYRIVGQRESSDGVFWELDLMLNNRTDEGPSPVDKNGLGFDL